MSIKAGRHPLLAYLQHCHHIAHIVHDGVIDRCGQGCLKTRFFGKKKNQKQKNQEKKTKKTKKPQKPAKTLSKKTSKTLFRLYAQKVHPQRGFKNVFPVI